MGGYAEVQGKNEDKVRPRPLLDYHHPLSNAIMMHNQDKDGKTSLPPPSHHLATLHCTLTDVRAVFTRPIRPPSLWFVCESYSDTPNDLTILRYTHIPAPFLLLVYHM
jgi:hypothetical protein